MDPNGHLPRTFCQFFNYLFSVTRKYIAWRFTLDGGNNSLLQGWANGGSGSIGDRIFRCLRFLTTKFLYFHINKNIISLFFLTL